MPDVFDSGTVQATEASAPTEKLADAGTNNPTQSSTATERLRDTATNNPSASFAAAETKNDASTVTGVATVTVTDTAIDDGATVAGTVSTNAGAEESDGTTHNAGLLSYPVTTITGPVTDPTLSNVTFGARLTLLADFLSTDTIVIDHRAQTIMVNGARYSGAWRGAFWPMLPGDNVISAGFAARGPGFTMSIAYPEAIR